MRFVLEGWCNNLGASVVTSKTVDTRLDTDETEFGVLVVTVTLEVLTNGDGLLDETV